MIEQMKSMETGKQSRTQKCLELKGKYAMNPRDETAYVIANAGKRSRLPDARSMSPGL